MAIKTEALVDLFKAGVKVNIWVAPYGETVPADSVAVGTDWGGNWEKLGWTKEGINLIQDQTKAHFKIQQSTMKVDSRILDESVRGETVLALSDPSRLAVVLGRASTDATDTAAASGQVGKTELSLNANVTQAQKWALGLESNHFVSDGSELPIRIFFPRAELMPNGTLMTFDSSNDDYSGLPMVWDAYADVSASMKFVTHQYITAPATA